MNRKSKHKTSDEVPLHVVSKSKLSWKSRIAHGIPRANKQKEQVQQRDIATRGSSKFECDRKREENSTECSCFHCAHDGTKTVPPRGMDREGCILSDAAHHEKETTVELGCQNHEGAKKVDERKTSIYETIW